MIGGSFFPSNPQWTTFAEDSSDPTSPGGVAFLYLASVALLIGDYVYIDATNSVNKGTTDTLYVAGIGLVVGGDAVGFNIIQERSHIGIAAAAAGQRVWVCTMGAAYGIAEAAFAVGVPVGPGAITAGRVDDGVTATVGQIAGISREAAGDVAAAVLIQVNHH